MGMLADIRELFKVEEQARVEPMTIEDMLEKIDTIMNYSPTSRGADDGTEA
jgi:hypothetical protein